MRISRLVSLAAVLGFAANAANAEVTAPTHCNLGTLHGTMAWSSTVLTATGAASSGSGQESYDGKGKMRYYEFSSDGVTTSTYTGTGTYTISEDCVATVVYDSEVVPWVYFVSADGEHYFWNNNQGVGHITSGRADRVSLALLVK
jgi:hypothetical protein